jgi:hypothetical protein
MGGNPQKEVVNSSERVNVNPHIIHVPNTSRKEHGESIKLEDDRLEFMQGNGRPDNFLGLNDVSSGD